MGGVGKLYDEVVMDHIKNVRNYREMCDATLHAEGVNPLCGDSFTVYLRLERELVADATFQCECCGISMASASIMTEAVKGRSVAEARRLSSEFRALLAGNPETTQPASAEAAAVLGVVREFPSRVSCASLAWVTLEAALDGRPRAVIGAM